MGAADVPPPPCVRCRSVFRGEVSHVGRGHQLERNVNFLFHSFASCQLHSRIHSARSLASGILGIEKDPLFEQQHDKTLWPQQICMLQDIFSKRTRDDWATIFSGTDACVSPVNSLRESFQDKHLQCRQSFIDMNGELQPAPVPRFSASPSVARQSLQAEGVAQVLQRWQIATCHQVQTNLNLSN